MLTIQHGCAGNKSSSAVDVKEIFVSILLQDEGAEYLIMNRGPDVENLDVENLNVDKLGLKGDTFDLEGDKKSWMSKSMDWMSKA